MGKCSIEYKELRFVIGDELTQVYVLIKADGDCPLGLQGWHHKTFPPSKNCEQILAEMFSTDSCSSWPQNAPDPHQPTKV